MGDTNAKIKGTKSKYMQFVNALLNDIEALEQMVNELINHLF